MEASEATDSHTEIGRQRQPTNYKPGRKSIALRDSQRQCICCDRHFNSARERSGDGGTVYVSLEQDTATASELRWAFVGSSAQNIERSFTTGIAFSTPFVVQNGVQLGDAVGVRLWGFLQG